jgi:hypothetical protein
MRLAAVLMLLPSVAVAQVAQLSPGDRVRLAAPGHVDRQYIGVLLRRSDDSVAVEVRAGRRARGVSARVDSVRVAVPSIVSLDVSRGRSRWTGAKHGALWGAAAGAFWGLAISAGAPTEGSTIGPTAALGIGAVLFTVPGAAVGALIRAERWERVIPR